MSYVITGNCFVMHDERLSCESKQSDSGKVYFVVRPGLCSIIPLEVRICDEHNKGSIFHSAQNM